MQIIVENKFADNWEEIGDKLVEIAKEQNKTVQISSI